MILQSLAAVLLAAPAPNDLVFNSPSGPLLVRLHVEIDGKPYEEAFHGAQQEYLRALFNYLDRNKDGFLDEAEARRAPLPVVGFTDLAGPDAHIAFNFRAIDADGDGRVSFEELTSYYREFEDGPFAVLTPPMTVGSPPDLFRLLDTDGDGKLSKEEIAAAAKVLARLDRDGNELLIPAGVDPERAAASGRVPTARVQSPGPIGNDPTQLKSLAGRQPDLELKVRLGKRAPGAALLEVVRSTGKVVMEHKENGEALISLGGARLELRCDRSWLTPRALGVLRDRYRRDARPLDGEYLDRVLGLQAEAMARRVSLISSRQGEGLWDLFDRNRDGVLGARELRNAPKVLASLDRDGDGFVSREKVPPSLVVQIGPGRTSFNRLSASEVVSLSERGGLEYPGPNVGGGPLWFRKMDRNGDGDVSMAEFLGSPEDFKKLDLDDDGLISREEAERADEARAKEK